MQLTIIHIHRFEFPHGMVPWATQADLRNLERHFMSALSDKIAEVNKTADEAIARVQGDVTALTAQIADLQAKVDAGGATQADMDALDQLEGKLAALDPTKPEVLPGT